MAQQVCWLYKHGDLCLDPWHPRQSLGMTTYAYIPSTRGVVEEDRQILGTCWPAGKKVSSMFSKRSCLKEKVGSDRVRYTMLSSGLWIHMHKHVHICTYHTQEGQANRKEGWGCSSLVECLPSMHRALDSFLSAAEMAMVTDTSNPGTQELEADYMKTTNKFMHSPYNK